jgi:L-rhamnose mutarotase
MQTLTRYCLALDLRDEQEAIASYDEHHRTVWPEVLESLKASGIQEMQIYRIRNRLVMIIEVTEAFSFARKKEMDEANETVQRWESLMSTLQQPLPWAKPGEKWMLMERVFHYESA